MGYSFFVLWLRFFFSLETELLHSTVYYSNFIVILLMFFFRWWWWWFHSFIHSFLVALGLRGFTSCSRQGLLFVVVCGLLIAVVCLVEHRLWGMRASIVAAPRLPGTGSVVVAHRLSFSEACGIFLDQLLNWHLLLWQVDSLPLSYQGSPHFLKKVPFIDSVCRIFVTGFGYWCISSAFKTFFLVFTSTF